MTEMSKTEMTKEEMLAKIEQLKADNLTITAQNIHLGRLVDAANQPKRLTMKVSDKGALSVYGLGRFPVTLYRGQWERLFTAIPDMKAFMAQNASLLATKD